MQFPWPALIGASIALFFMVVVPIMRARTATSALMRDDPSGVAFTVVALPEVRAQISRLIRAFGQEGSAPSSLSRPVAFLDDETLRLYKASANGRPTLQVPRSQIVSVELGWVKAWPRAVRSVQCTIATASGNEVLDLPVFTATSLVSSVSSTAAEILVVDINDKLWPIEAEEPRR